MSDELGILDAAAAIQAAIRKRDTGILREVPDIPPENVSAYPFVVIHAGDGEITGNSPEDVRGDHSLAMEIHIARKDMPYDYTTATMALGLVVDAVFSGYKDHELRPVERYERVSYSLRPMRWGGIDTIGYDIRIEGVKIRVQIS